MSWQAAAWVEALDYDRCKGIAYRVLMKLAHVAATDGSRAWRSKAAMSEELGVSQESIRRALRELESLRLIKRGDQQHVKHLPGNRRPVVYNLAMASTQPEIFDLDEVDFAPRPGGNELSTSGGNDLSTGGTKSGSRGHKTENHPSIEEIEISSTQIDPSTREVVYDEPRCSKGHPAVGTTGGGLLVCREGDYCAAPLAVMA